MLSGPAPRQPVLITVEELLTVTPPYCGAPGPAHSRCVRAEHEPSQLHAALGTDTAGHPVVVTWYRPDTTAWPLAGLSGGRPGDANSTEPGA